MWNPGGARNNRGLPATAEVNVTSLVDVAFTLLVIFIITAPILQGGIEVELPQAETAQITATEGVVVSLTKDGDIFIGDVPVKSAAEFEAIYAEYVRGRNVREAYLKGDAAVPYGRVAEILGLMKKLDVAEVGLVADPVRTR
jgi:biopolymer transport protein TolR